MVRLHGGMWEAVHPLDADHYNYIQAQSLTSCPSISILIGKNITGKILKPQMTNRYSSTVMCLCQLSRAILLAWYVAQVLANLKVSITWPRHILHVKGIIESYPLCMVMARLYDK